MLSSGEADPWLMDTVWILLHLCLGLLSCWIMNLTPVKFFLDAILHCGSYVYPSVLTSSLTLLAEIQVQTLTDPPSCLQLKRWLFEQELSNVDYDETSVHSGWIGWRSRCISCPVSGLCWICFWFLSTWLSETGLLPLFLSSSCPVSSIILRTHFTSCWDLPSF